MDESLYSLEQARGWSPRIIGGAASLAKAFAERAGDAKTLMELYAVQMESRALGILNRNLDDDRYGVFRAEPGIELRSQDVYLGGVYGLFTNSIDVWEAMKADGTLSEKDYGILMNQYRDLLVSNYEAIAKGLEDERRKALSEPKAAVARLFRSGLHPKDAPFKASPFPHLSSEENAYCETIGVWPGPWDGHRAFGEDQLDALIAEFEDAKEEEARVEKEEEEERKAETDLVKPEEAATLMEKAGESGENLMDRLFTNTEKKEILSGEFAKTYGEVITHGRFRPMAAPQLWNGLVFNAENAVYLNAKLQTRPDWIPLFLTREDMGTLGIRPYPEAEAVSVIKREVGGMVVRDVVFNISDTTFPEKLPSHFDLLKNALSVPNPKTYNKVLTEEAVNAYTHEWFRFRKAADSIHESRLSDPEEMFVNILVGTTLGNGAGWEAQLEDLRSLPFPDSVTIEKDGNRYPAYELYRHAGREFEAVLEEHKGAYPSLGLPCERLMKEFDEAIREAKEKGLGTDTETLINTIKR